MTLLETSAILQGYWPIFTGFTLFVLWLGRLEWKSTNNSIRIKRLEDKDESIEKLRISVERIDARLSVLLPDYDGKK